LKETTVLMGNGDLVPIAAFAGLPDPEKHAKRLQRDVVVRVHFAVELEEPASTKPEMPPPRFCTFSLRYASDGSRDLYYWEYRKTLGDIERLGTPKEPF